MVSEIYTNIEICFIQILPDKFCSEIGQYIPLNVYLRVRNCDACCGVYLHDKKCIDNLGNMMDFYVVKPYYVVLLEYKGFGSFNVEVFNNSNVEIDYPLRPICSKKQRLIGDVCTTKPREFVPIELAKMAATFYYNVLNKSPFFCNIVIGKQHLEESIKIKVIF